MKKIYLIVLLVVASFVSRAQVELPYTFAFEGDAFYQSGWSFLSNDPSCYYYFLSGQQQGVLMFLSSPPSPDYEPCDSHYCQYLISPRFTNNTEDPVQIRFRYIIPNEQHTRETFVIGYCTEDAFTSQDDFVWLEDTVVCTNYESWMMYQGNVPSDAQYVAVAYTSGNQWALFVDDFLIRSDSPDAVHSFTVNADARGSFTVTTGGETTSNPTTIVQEGDELTYTVTANPGCRIDSLHINGTPYHFSSPQTTFTQTIFPVIVDYVVDVFFSNITYKIQILAAEHGRIVPDGGAGHELVVPWDTTVGFRFYPDEGYHINTVVLIHDGLPHYYNELPDTLTISNIRQDYMLFVDFALNDYVVSVSAGEGGTVSPYGEVPVQGLSSPQFRISANPGYLIDTIYVDDEPLTFDEQYSVYVYTFDRVVGDHTLHAIFRHEPYIVHYTCDPHGTVSAIGGISVGLDSLQIYYEDTILFHFSVEEGYELSDLQLNGVSIGVSNPYLLTRVTQNSLFHAIVEEKTFHVTTSIHGTGNILPLQSGAIGYFDTARFVILSGMCMQADSLLLDSELLPLSDTVLISHLEGEHTLDAYFSQIIYSMEIRPCDHGSIIGSQEVMCGNTSRLKIVPDHCYRFTHFYLDGVVRPDLLRVINDTIWAYVSSVSEDHVVSADFERIPYTVTVTSTGAGTVSPGVVGTVLCDTTLYFEIVPDDCHYVESVTVNGENAESIIRRYPNGNSGFGDTLRFELEQIEQDYSVAVEFRQFDFPLSLTAGDHGALSATGTLQLPCGTDTVITITPDVCYEIASVRVDGEDVTGELHYIGAAATYSFVNLHAAHSLEADFAMQTYTVTVVPDAHGSILQNRDTVVMCGNDLTCVAVPDECYQIDSVWLDGVVINDILDYRPNTNRLIGDSAVYVLSGISENHVVRVSFKPIVYEMLAAAFDSENGTVVFSEPGTTIQCGSSVTLTMTPEDCYSIKEVWYNGELTTDYEVDENGVGTLAIPSANEDIYISVIYEMNQYSLGLAQETQHGSIDYLPAVRPCGDAVRLSYHPDDCYHLDSVMIDGEWILASALSEEGGVLIYDIQNIHSDLLLDAAFSVDSFHFVSNEGAPLSVTDSMLECGQSLVVYAVHEDCHQLDSVRLDGTIYTTSDIDGNFLNVVGDTLFIHLENLHSDHNLAVFYSQSQYQVRINTEGHGRVYGPSTQIVSCGDSVAYAISAADCQHLDYVTINGSVYPMDNDTLLVINEVRSNMRIVVYFTPDVYEMSVNCNELGVFLGEDGPVDCGTDLEYVFKPLDCAVLDSVVMDGVCVNDLLVYNPLPTLLLDSVASSHVIKAIFKYLPYQVDIETDNFDFVDMEPVNIVNCGSDFRVRITPDQCHLISDILLDGHSVISDLEGEDDDYLFTIPNVRQDCHLEIVFSKKTQQIVTLLVNSEGNVLSQEEATIECGNDTTLYPTVYNDCYSIDSVYMNRRRVELQNSYLLNNVVGDMEMIVFMHKEEYRVNVLSQGHLTMTEGDFFQRLLCGDTLHLGFAPDEGYYISELIVDEETVPVTDHLEFDNIHRDHDIIVFTKPFQYQVVVIANEGGTAQPESVMASYGTDVTIQLVPEGCHEVRALTVDGVDYMDSLQHHEGYDELTIHALTSDREVVVDFERFEFACTASSAEGGSVHPYSPLVLCGDTVGVSVIPSACYHLDSVWVNGELVPEDQLQQTGTEVYFRINDVRTDCHIEARFERNDYSITVGNHGDGVVATTADQVTCGGGFSFYVVPAPCTRLQSVLLNGMDITAHLTYRDNVNPWLPDTACFTVSDVTEDQLVEVSYQSDGNRTIDLTFIEGSNVLRHETVSVACGGDTVLPVSFECYRLDSIFVDGVQIPLDDSCRFMDVIADHTVQVMLSRIQYLIYVDEAVEHGTVSVPSSVVNCGESVTLTVIPDGCYSVDSVLVNGENVGAVTSYTISNMEEDKSVMAYFSTNEYNVEVVAGEHGTVANPGVNVVRCGDSFAVLIIPDECYKIGIVRVDGRWSNPLLHGDTLILDEVVENHVINIGFEIRHYDQFISFNNVGGTVSPAFISSSCGSDVTYTITPNDCYRIDTVWINGVALPSDSLVVNGSIATFTMHDVRQTNHIEVRFAGIFYQFEVENNGDGIVHLEHSSINCNGDATFYILPSQCERILSAVLNGVDITNDLDIHPNANPLRPDTAFYTIPSMSADQLLQINYQRLPDNQVSITYTDGAVELYAADMALACGETLPLSIAYDCYTIDSVWVNGTNVGAVSEWALSSNLTDQTVRAFFSRNRYDVQVNAGEGGEIVPSIDTTVLCGDPVAVTIIPDACHNIASVVVDGYDLGNVSSYNFENVSENHTVTATFARKEFVLTPSAGTGGSITPNVTTTVSCSSNYTFDFEPNVGYSISAIVVDGDTLAAADFYTFENVQDNHTVKVLFSRNRYEITATAGVGGSVSPENSIVEYGERQTITIVANDCYHIDSVFADGVYVGPYPTYTFSDVTTDHTLAATFAINEYEITASVEGHGSIAPDSVTTVSCGDGVVYTLVPETGWHISGLLVDGEAVEIAETYTFADVHDSHTITAQFAINEYTVTATAGEGGSVIPTETVASYGEYVTVEITADDCYHIDSVFADGNYVGVESSYTFSNIEANHTLAATFAINEYEITASVEGQGTILPDNVTAVSCGDGVVYTLVPETGWHISGLLVDGEAVEIAETYTFADVRNNHTITAQFAINEYTVTATAGEGGSVTPTETVAFYGESVTIETTAADCYHIDSVFADGNYVGVESSYTFSNIEANHTLAATFAINEYEITASAEGQGTILPANATAVSCGDDVVYTLVPETGWHISGLLVDGEPVETVETYTFANVRDNHTITAQFAINEYTVTATAGEGGSVTPAETVASYGESVTVEITAADCYRIDSVFADGSYVGAESSYTFSSIEANHTLAATFAINEYEITASAEDQGTILPANATAVSCGDDVVYTLVPETGWHISGLLVDGEPVETAETYTFANVRDSHTITAQFAINEYTVTATAGEGGSVTPAETVASYGESVTVEITAADCYRIDSVFADGNYVGAESSYTFSNIEADHTLAATFAINMYEISAVQSEHGTITPAIDTIVSCGDDVIYRIVPETGWHISSLLVDGEPMVVTGIYTFADIHGNHTITANFAVNEFEVTATAGDGGSVNSSLVEASYGEDVTIRIIPDDCYQVDSVYVDGVYVGRMSSYTFENVDANHTLYVTFATIEYTIAVFPSPQNGTITPANMTTVNCGDSILYTITPNEGYRVVEVIVDGVSTVPFETYLFADVHANHRITAQFAVNEFAVTATAGEGGSVSPTDTSVVSGETVTIAITSDDCYDVESVTVDGVEVGPVSSYVFENVTAPHTLDATFILREFILTPHTSVGGTITPDETDIAECGTDYTYHIEPAAGYSISGIVVDGDTLAAAAEYTFENIRNNHWIKPLFAINEYTVTATAGEGGSVSPTDTTVVYGETVTIAITPDDCYDVESVTVDGVEVGPVSSYVFENVTAPHALNATFILREFILTPHTSVGGTITPDETDIAECGTDYTYHIEPAAGYSISGIVVDGDTLAAAAEYTFENIRNNHWIKPLFAINEYTVTATAGEGGSVSPMDTTVVYGETVTIAITPDDCYDVESVTVDGVEVGPVSSYVFENVTAPHALNATFILREFILTPHTSVGGTITPDETDIAECGTDYTYHFEPAAGYSISGIVVDGDTLAAAAEYTFENIRNNHWIKPLFAINEYTVTATAGEGGSVSPTDTTVVYGETVTVEITPEDCYHIESVVVNGENVGAITSYELSDISSDQVVEAFFARNNYDVFVTVSNENELLFFDTIRALPCGSDTVVNVPLFDCYHVDSIVVNGERMDGIETVLIEDIHENKDIVFFLSREQFIIVATHQGNGTVSPSDTVHTPCDSQVQFTFTPDEGWYVEDLVVDGESLGTPTENQYTFVNINASHTIEVVFAPIAFIITSSIDPIDAGNINPYGQTLVNYGADQTYNISPFPGYEVVDVEVDGVSQGAITTYTFHNVTANHTIVAHLLTVGVEENAVNEDVLVWPNPVENSCHIRIPDVNATHTMELQLFDAQGKMVLRKQVEAGETEIDFYGRPSGMYMLRIVTNSNVIATKKVIRK